MATNLRAPFFLTQKLLPYIPRGGRIILISSIAARRFSFGMHQTAYAISKAAVEALARNWAVEVSPINPARSWHSNSDLSLANPAALLSMVSILFLNPLYLKCIAHSCSTIGRVC